MAPSATGMHAGRASGASRARPSAVSEVPMPHVAKRLTPVLMVPEIEPCLPFWERLGWVKVADVPHGGRLGFAILVKDGLELMYQSQASVADDNPAIATAPMGGTFLFLEVDDLDAVIAATAGAPVFAERRTTFYGMHEIGVREPGGNPVIFAQPTGEAQPAG